MLHVPRSVSFAAWGTAVVQGREDVSRLVRALARPDDDEHRVDGAEDLPALIALAAERGATGFRPVLPVPGDVSGLPGPAEFNVRVCAVGEAAITTGAARALGIVPDVVEYGSELEPGHLVTWTARDVESRPHLDAGDLGEADRGLRRALARTTEVLIELDVARWRPDVAELWVDLTDAALDPLALPPGWPARAVQMLTSALRLRAVIALATDDDGGAVSTWEAQRRRATLRELDVAARHAIRAAATPSTPGRA